MSEKELWKKWVTNPMDIAESEKIVWIDLQQIISDIPTELKPISRCRKINHSRDGSPWNSYKKAFY
jgi:hypothetical protein